VGFAGHFFAGDSYVVLYEFEEEGNFKCVVYHWHGRETTSDESASACMHATNMSKGKGQNVLVLRVVQGKEPVNFTALFRGHMIVHFGGITSGYLNRKDQSHERGEDHLFRLKGTNEWDMRTFEVPLNEGSLCSSDCFVLVTPYDVTIWRGSASNEGQQQMVQDIARDLLPLDEVSDRSLLILDEGNETHDFWASLGERGNVPAAEETSHAHEPRMYQCTDVTGVFNVEELECAGQEDLDENRVMIVDCGHAVYVWMGSMASEVLQENSLSLGACQSSLIPYFLTPCVLVQRARSWWWMALGVLKHELREWKQELSQLRSSSSLLVGMRTCANVFPAFTHL
jgi:hypothetical protein